MPSWEEFAHQVPLQAIEEDFVALPELGGRRANYPIVTNVQTAALMHEVTTDWIQSACYAENSGSWGAYGAPGNYQGDVWSIQLTARPGYYVAPEIQQQLGWLDEGEAGPNG